MSVARVVVVAPGSPAEVAGIAPGDELLLVNGEAIRDVIRYQLQADEPQIELDIRRGGLETTVNITKEAGVSLGIELDSAVFDRVRTCDNHCPFCFIYQLPPGMRKSLSLKDDDFRLSFLYGNFTTLTRFTEADLERVIAEQLSPLYVSIHATDPDVRTKLLRNRRGATSLRWLRAILDAGICVHGQVVVCPGINDGDVLDDTLLGIFEKYPEIASVGVVPLGVSAYNKEPEMRPHTKAEAEKVLDVVASWQALFSATLGRRTVYCSDEYYLLAGRDFPNLAEYEDCPQHENGIGMAATIGLEIEAALSGHGDAANAVEPREGFFSWVDGARPDGYRANGTTPITLRRRMNADAPVVIITGEMGEVVLRPYLSALSAHAGVTVSTLSVPNKFFGGNIGVTGLITGSDLSAVLVGKSPTARYLLPDVTLSRGRFLDDTTIEDLPLPVEVVPTSGYGLVGALKLIKRAA